MTITREKAYEMIKELLAAEEENDTMNLTRAERRQFQQIVEDAFNEPFKMISVQTPEGELRAYVGTDPNYPSIDVMLNPKGTDVEINVAFTEYNADRGIISAIYGDAMDEEPTYEESLKNLDECKNFMDEEREGER